MAPKPHRIHLPHWADRLGAFGAFLCALHCALVPVALALVPAFGLGMASWHGFERTFTAIATVLALTSLYVGFRSHRAYHAWLLVVPGLVLVWAGLLLHPLQDARMLHASTMAIGGVLIGLAHLINLRLSWGHSH